MVFDLQKTRDSKTWRAINDALAIQGIIGILAGIGTAIRVWAIHEPFHVIFFWFLLTTAAAFVATHYGWRIWAAWKTSKGRGDVPPIVDATRPPSEPNLVMRDLQYGTFGIVNGVWTCNTPPEWLQYRVWMLQIRNEPIPGKHVADAIKLSAQVVISINGVEQCSGSPSPWTEERFNSVTIPHGTDKSLILAVCDRSPGLAGYWEVVTDMRIDESSPVRQDMQAIPYQLRGDLKVRLLSNGRLLKTEFFKWERNLETQYFDIRPVPKPHPAP